MNKKMFLLLGLLIISLLLYGNSAFSFDGLPNAHFGNDSYGLGMGSTGFGDLFRIGTNYQNPAMLANANKTIFSTAVRMGYLWYLDEAGAGYRDEEIHFPYFTFSFPAYKHRFGIVYQPYLSGLLRNEKMRDDEYSYKEINRISEIVNKISLAYAYRFDYINIGMSIHYFLGHQIRYWELDFTDSSFQDAKYEKEKSFQNAGFSFGLSQKKETFSWSLAFQSGSLLDGDSIYRFNFTPGADTLQTEEKLFEVPGILSFGYTQRLPKQLKISTEFHYELWKRTDFYEKNSYKIGFGTSYDPISGYGKWYERIPLRIGAYYRLLPFTKNNTKIAEKAITWGFTIPFVATEKQLDFACEYILRGDENTHGVRDKILYFSIGINGFDIFTRRPKKTAPREIPEAEF